MPNLLRNEAAEIAEQILEERSEKLNAWETGFCESMVDYSYPELTEKQTAKLNSIYDRVMR